MGDSQDESGSSSIFGKIKETVLSLNGQPSHYQRRRHREEQIATAYELQRNAALKGSAFFTFLGISSTVLSHHLFPKFRSQTLAIKGFIVSGFTIFGFVVGADSILLNHETRQRSEEEVIRNVAKRELAKQGIMPSETEIEKWKDQTRERLMKERGEAL